MRSIVAEAKAPAVFFPGCDMEKINSEHFTRHMTLEEAGAPHSHMTVGFPGERVPLWGFVDEAGVKWISERVADDGVYFSAEKLELPCSIDWCRGHAHAEARTFEELAHNGPRMSLMSGRSVSDGTTFLTESDAVRKVYASLDFDGEFDSTELSALAGQLQEAAKTLLKLNLMLRVLNAQDHTATTAVSA